MRGAGNVIDVFNAQPGDPPVWTDPADCIGYGEVEYNLIRSHNCSSLPPTNQLGTPSYVVGQTSRPDNLVGPDLHLAMGSAGIDAAGPTAPATDIDGGRQTKAPTNRVRSLPQ